MALNIKNAEVEQLAAEVAQLTGESKTEAIRKALEERLASLPVRAEYSRGEELRRWLETEVWPTLPGETRGKRLTREEEEDALGYGPGGY